MPRQAQQAKQTEQVVKVETFSANQLIAERDDQYNDAWLVTGQLKAWLADRGLTQEIDMSGLGFAADMVLNKLVRVLNDPMHLDSWDDIAGYATLVSNHLRIRAANLAEHAHKAG